MQKVRRVIYAPPELDEWVEKKAEKDVRTPPNYYLKLAQDAKLAEEAREGDSSE